IHTRSTINIVGIKGPVTRPTQNAAYIKIKPYSVPQNELGQAHTGMEHNYGSQRRCNVFLFGPEQGKQTQGSQGRRRNDQEVLDRTATKRLKLSAQQYCPTD